MNSRPWERYTRECQAADLKIKIKASLEVGMVPADYRLSLFQPERQQNAYFREAMYSLDNVNTCNIKSGLAAFLPFLNATSFFSIKEWSTVAI